MGGPEQLERSSVKKQSGGGGCPVRIDDSSSSSSSNDGSGSSPFWGWVGNLTASNASSNLSTPLSSSSSSTTTSSSNTNEGGHSSCSVASIEEAAQHGQSRQPGQRMLLDTRRQVSSIPRVVAGDVNSNDGTTEMGTNNLPHHQHDESENKWVYPSEQQLFNAMRRKGWKDVPEESVPIVLQIHNAVNEGTWDKICQWEGTTQLRLVKFEGRPQTLTPKAFLFSKLLRWNPLPFDRHDWYVSPTTDDTTHDNNNNVNITGTTTRRKPLQRYVIDYYMMDQADPRLPPFTHIDVRPALDDYRGVYLHGQRFFQKALPGISTYLHQLYLRQQQQHKQQRTIGQDSTCNEK